MSAPTPEGRGIPWPGAQAARPALADAGEADAAAAAETATRAARRRALWVREAKVIAVSYAINGACLALFALTGTVHWSAAVLYAVPGWIACGLAAHWIASGRSERWRDPSVSTPQSAAGMAICGVGMVLYPQVTFLYVLILFTIFLGATYRTPRRQIDIAWGVASLLLGAATLTGDRTLQIPHASAVEQFAAWACFTTTLARCVLLSLINSGHNQLLRTRGQQMAETLAQIERLANHDELTGLLNRRSILRCVAEEIDRAARDGSPLTVALLDIDHFKSVNDRLGHVAGDHTLRGFAAAVEARRRGTDRFGRHGGEEFLLVLPDTRADEAARAVERLRDAVSAHDWSAISPDLAMRFSAGTATWRDGESVEQLISRADRGLYGAKDAGRNCLRAG